MVPRDDDATVLPGLSDWHVANACVELVTPRAGNKPWRALVSKEISADEFVGNMSP
jgi:hypothetical protein